MGEVSVQENVKRRAANGVATAPAGSVPKLRLVPRRISLNHLVRAAIAGFDTYGDVFQLVLPVPLRIFCLRQPDDIKAVTSHRECGAIKPGGMVPKADWFMGDGIYNDVGGDTWSAKRRSLAPAFTERMAVQSSGKLPRSFESMSRRWIDFGHLRAIDLYSELLRFVLDFSADALFSEKLDDEWLDWIVPSTTFVEDMFVTLTPYWVPTANNLKFRGIKGRYHQLMDEIIQKHRRAPEVHEDMVRSLIDEGHSDAEIKAEMFSAYLGTPAMALTIMWGVFVLFTNREILLKVRSELKQTIGDRAPDASDLSAFPYLEMFVKEVLRVFPSFWGSLRYARTAIEIGGHTFPPRSIFAMIRVAAQRLPEYWENPHDFIPERHAKRNSCPHALLPFGLGPRMCLGRSLATTIAPLAIASIAQRFDVVPSVNRIGLRYGFGMYPAQPIMAAVRPVNS